MVTNGKIKQVSNVKDNAATMKPIFVVALSDLAGLWEKMDMVVQAEWQFLLRNDISRLMRLSRIKENLSETILDKEREVREMFALAIPETETGKDGLAKALDRRLGHREARGLLRLLRKRDYFMRLSSVTNARILHWIEERLGFFSELVEILSGAATKEELTYNLSAFSKKRPYGNGQGMGIGIARRDSLSMDNSKILEKGFASYSVQIGAIPGEGS